MIGGREPTGIEIGDIKYIFQAIGALFGINPDTPFPLNLIEAVGHMFEQFIIPLPQFTDVIFDAMAAWAEDLDSLMPQSMPSPNSQMQLFVGFRIFKIRLELSETFH